MTTRNIRVTIALTLGLMFAQCGDKPTPVPTPTPTPTTGTPTVSLTSTGSVLQTGASAYGTINPANNTVSLKAYFSTSPNPNETSTQVQMGTVSGNTDQAISVALPNLVPNTLYYVKILLTYSKNNASTQIWSNELSFTTLTSTTAPNAGVTSVNVVNATTIAIEGTVSSDGGSPITGRSFTISWLNDMTSQTDSEVITNPTVNGNTFTYTKTNCIPGTVVSVKSKVSNAVGSAESASAQATTPGYHVGQLVLNGAAVVYKITSSDYIHFKAMSMENIMPNAGAGDPAHNIPAGYSWYDYVGSAHVLCGAQSATDGRVNTTTIMNVITGASVARSVYTYTSGGKVTSGTFYLPARDEMVEMMQIGKTIAKVTGTLTGDPVNNMYWTSTEGTTALYAYKVSLSASSFTDVKSGYGFGRGCFVQ